MPRHPRLFLSYGRGVYSYDMSRGTRIFLLSCALVFVCAGSYLAYAQRALTLVDLSTMPYEEKTTYWESRIRERGDEHAFAEFNASSDSVPPVERHWEQHLFGNALYAVHGLDGIALCDDSFDNACFHSFMISGIEEFGVAATDKLHEACVTILGTDAYQCLHGLGHALLGVFGYTEEGLKQSIAVCDAHPEPDRRGVNHGCVNGAFMEYNSPMDITGYEPRPFTEDGAFEPCTSLEDRAHRSACTYAQLYWWFSSLKHEEPAERLAHIGALCRRMNTDNTEMYQVCIQGAGNALDTTVDYDPAKVADACATIDPDPAMRLLCQKNAAIRFSFYSPLETALQACGGLPDADKNTCRDYLSNGVVKKK